MTNNGFKVIEVDRDVTAPSGDGSGRGDSFIIFYVSANSELPIDEVENLAIEAVQNEVSDGFSFFESERLDDRLIEVTAFMN